MKNNQVLLLFFFCSVLTAFGKDSTDGNVFTIKNPDFKTSPYSGMTRQHWVDAAQYLLEGAFSYVTKLDDPMQFPKQFDKTYPTRDDQRPVERLEGLSRTLFIAAPLLRENPDLEMNGMRVLDYYQHQLLQLIQPGSPLFIPLRGNRGASQTLVEFGALAISLSMIPDLLWDPMTQEQKDALAATMISYGNGPTVNSNWRFFNIFVLSFFRDKGYEAVDERVLKENIDKALAFYRGGGWYNDAPAYDYYSMWAFQLYGPLWAEWYGDEIDPVAADAFRSNLLEMLDSYPYLYNKKGQMNMWGRSISYRFASVAPFPMLGFSDRQDLNFGWYRRISSATLLQFLQHPDFLQDRVPSLGFYGPFEPAVQIYSCRGSVYWMGKVFFTLLLPESHPFWTSVENNGAWDHEMEKNKVYNRFEPETNLMITNYPNVGGSEIRSWCHESVARDWQKFRSSENYNKLAYHTEFPWLADDKNGAVSMNYAVRNAKEDWEVLRLYTFRSFENGVYRRDAVLETNPNIRFELADIPFEDGVIRVDKVHSPEPVTIRYGHYALPIMEHIPMRMRRFECNGLQAASIRNGTHELALLPSSGWSGSVEAVSTRDLHPVRPEAVVLNLEERIEGSRILVTVQLWQMQNRWKRIQKKNPIQSISISADQRTVRVSCQNGKEYVVYFD